MRGIAYIAVLPLLFLSCGGGRGRIRLEGTFRNLNQADFLIYSPDGAFEDIDTLHLLKGKFRKDLAVSGGPYTFTIIYPNFSTLSFVASERDNVLIKGDALALADVRVEGADTVVVRQATMDKKLKVGSNLPKADVIEKSRQEGKHLLVGFWANWRGGSAAVNTNIKRAISDYGENLCALSYSLDVDRRMRRMGEGKDSLAWDTYCDYLAWDSPAVRTLGIDNIPYFILVNPDGKIVALGSNFRSDIEPELKKLIK